MPTATDAKLTPAMRQYQRFKQRHPDCVLFFRMGDFYEMFHDDAKLAHRVLGVTLTQRTEGVPMAGVPHHAVEGYLRRMIQAGYRVAVCDQVEDPAQAKGIVKRDVTRVVTPGTLTDEALLADDKENPLAAVVFHSDEQARHSSEKSMGGGQASIAWTELSTGAFSIVTLPGAQIGDELARIGPSELLYCETADGEVPPRIAALVDSTNCAVTGRPVWQFRLGEAAEVLKKQYQVARLSGFGLGDDDPALSAAGAVVHYLLETQRAVRRGGPEKPGQGTARLAHLQPPRRFERGRHLVIDQTSLRSLEVERTIRSGETKGSLLGVMQGCLTAMGKRLLRHWLCYPLRDRSAIELRQGVVEALVNDARFRDELAKALNNVHDVPRITARLSVGRATPRDLVALSRSTLTSGAFAAMLADRRTLARQREAFEQLAGPLGELGERIKSACKDAPPAHLREGGLIRDGYDKQLDEYRALQRDSHSWLARYQKQLIGQTGIASLKVGYNKVFGYYIEVTAAHRDKIDDRADAFRAWTRKQTLKNAERFITPELKEYEGKVLSAESRAIAREQDLFVELSAAAEARAGDLQRFSGLVAELDVLGCFAELAVRRRYVRPKIVDEPVLHIAAGRHPVLEQTLGDRFVPNDVDLGNDTDATLALITGPNMAGKSTYIRQAALVTLMAHTGSFVPADRATIGVCDRIFTRIGASDELHTGQSTFMVEMTETANICHHATPGSLVILDEIGRGTSTLDGLSLAWAIAEHLAQQRPRCLFATHYHELTSLADRYENVVNLNVTVREWQDQIVFLHRIAPGGTNRSYGIHVARIAGLPREVVERADELLGELEVQHGATNEAPRAAPDHDKQLPLFTQYLEHPILERLRQIDLEGLSPMAAFDLVRQWRAEVTERDTPD